MSALLPAFSYWLRWLLRRRLAQAHPQLQGDWREIHGPWRLDFHAGVEQHGRWEGEWSGTLHHTRKRHDHGRYVLVMNGPTRGRLTLFDEGRELCSATVDFEGTHRLDFGSADYRR